MTYKGIVKNNTIIPEEPLNLVDGTEVEIVLINKDKSIDPVCGSWSDDRSAEDLIKDIHESRYSREKEINL